MIHIYGYTSHILSYEFISILECLAVQSLYLYRDTKYQNQPYVIGQIYNRISYAQIWSNLIKHKNVEFN